MIRRKGSCWCNKKAGVVHTEVTCSRDVSWDILSMWHVAQSSACWTSWNSSSGQNISQINFFRYIKIQLHSEAERTQTKEMNQNIQSVFFVYKSWILIYLKWSIGVAQLLKYQFSCQDMLLQHISGSSHNYFMFVHMLWFCACYMSPHCAPQVFCSTSMSQQQDP